MALKLAARRPISSEEVTSTSACSPFCRRCTASSSSVIGRVRPRDSIQVPAIRMARPIRAMAPSAQNMASNGFIARAIG